MHVRRPRDERGVTLTEVLVVVVLLGVIMVPLGNALIGYIRHSDAVSRRLGESHDVQISAAYFAQDVQSIGVRDWTTHPFPLKQSIELNVAPTGGLFPCGASGTPNAVIRLAWDDPANTANTIRVAYVVMTVGGERQLKRLTCNGSSTPSSTIVLAHNLDAAAPTVTCSTPTTCTDPDVPQKVRLTLRIIDPVNAAAGDPPVVVNLEGQRRQT